ncbi:dihydrofolate reductase [Latilactobacillus fuchuensis]|uniref:Dihydrofolate reductase n=1 Tax=Latilactobacillus fuchuensis TaxID=164393 RepID=A0A2N9DVJ5_9LACO|nr:dihydrofolate reductase [Latilactobacillus fuchuensis]SPC38538.1 Dihydrofolate reductase [Latilactobacillus fuchuensis]
MIAFLWAEDQNGLIGQDGHLPWRLPNDLANFKRETINEVVVMGRKTYDSLPKRPLPGRQNIIITRQVGLTAEPGVLVMTQSAELLTYAQQNPTKKLFIIGGAEIFNLFKADVDYLYVTKIAAAFKGDVYMPELDYTQFKRIDVKAGVVDDRNRYPHTFEIYQRLD